MKHAICIIFMHTLLWLCSRAYNFFCLNQHAHEMCLVEHVSEKDKKIVFFFKMLLRLGVLRVLCCSVCWFLYGHFVMLHLNLTYLHCLQHSYFKHLFNLYCTSTLHTFTFVLSQSHKYM